MTDKDIVKALRRCTTLTSGCRCDNCPAEPHKTGKRGCAYVSLEAADAIERLTVLIEARTEERETLKQDNALINLNLESITADVERLTRERNAQWISVKDRLPDEGTEALIYAAAKANGCAKGDRVTIAKWDRTYFMWNSFGELRWHVWQYFDYDYEVTHWMPLPEPPRAENGGNDDD